MAEPATANANQSISADTPTEKGVQTLISLIGSGRARRSPPRGDTVQINTSDGEDPPVIPPEAVALLIPAITGQQQKTQQTQAGPTPQHYPRYIPAGYEDDLAREEGFVDDFEKQLWLDGGFWVSGGYEEKYVPSSPPPKRRNTNKNLRASIHQ